MNKVFISQTANTNSDAIGVHPTEASKWLSALRSNHFVECKVHLTGNFQPQANRYLLSIPRLLADDGVLIIEYGQVAAESKQQLLAILKSMGLYMHGSTQSTLTYGKRQLKSDLVGDKLHIGHYKKEEKPSTIDQDDLLKDDIVVKKPTIENCATKAKACANCSCGRKQAEQNKSQQQLIKGIAQGTTKSNCGNCYLGDAFRCASCPYKGLPAFKPGEKIQLKLPEDLSGNQAQAGKVNIVGGKIKIDL